MSRRFQHAAAWIAVQTIFAFSGLVALGVGVNNARCDIDARLLPGNNGPLGVGADGALFHAGRWALIVGMFAGIVAVMFGMYLSWIDTIRVRTLLILMTLSVAQFTVALVVWSAQVDSTPFCSFDATAIATGALMIALMAVTVAFCALRTAWSSADLDTSDGPGPVAVGERPPPTTPARDAREVARPFLIQMAGHGGAGKSTVARALEERLDAIAVDLDVVKSKLLDGGTSWDEASSQSYDTIYRLVDDLFTTSNPIIIVDTPSYWPEIHERLTATADRHAAGYAFVECTASSDTRANRLDERTPLRSQAPSASTNPVDAPESLGPVHDRTVERPRGRHVIELDTDDASVDALVDIVVSQIATTSR